MSSETPQPAGYSSTDAAETDALNVFRSAIDSKRVKEDIKGRDKHPNIDGYLELVDDQRKPLGKLEVQVKKLSEGSRTYSCPISLLSYTERTPLPVLLIGVDTTAKRAFWRHITTADLPRKIGQQTIQVSFNDPEDAVCDEGAYYSKWLTIARDYCERVSRYDALRKIAKIATPMIGQKSPEIVQIQRYIDELNGLLDHDFRCLKRSMFPGVWKVGIAVQQWTQAWAQYALFAIEEGRNEPLIKQIDPKADIFSDPDLGYFTSRGDSSIAANPAAAARRFVYERLEKLILSDGLPLGSEFLGAEYIFAFIDRFSGPLGLQRKDRYEASELDFALSQYFPRWCAAARGAMAWYPPHIPYFDPGIAGMLLGRSIGDQVKRSVDRREPIPPINVGMTEFSLLQVHWLVARLRASGKAIERPFLQGSGSGSWIWQRFTAQEAFANAKTLYTSFLSAYRAFIQHNDMRYEDLLPFSDVSRVTYFYTHAEHPRSECPSLDELQLVAIEGATSGDPAITVLPGESEARTRIGTLQADMEFEGQRYRVRRFSQSMGDPLFEKTPMRMLVYQSLLTKLKTRLLGDPGDGSATL